MASPDLPKARRESVNSPECESEVVAGRVPGEGADVVDVEEELAEVAEEEGEDEQDQDARQLGLAPRRRRRGRRVLHINTGENQNRFPGPKV